MTGREFKDSTFYHIAKITSAVGSPKRLEIVDFLSQGDKDVELLSREDTMNFVNTSRHLQILKNDGVVRARKEGVRVVYSLASDEEVRCWKNIQALAERSSAEIREITGTFLRERSVFEPISMKELEAMMKHRGVTLIDVRPKDEYLKGHLPGAVSVPIPELRSYEKSFPPQERNRCILRTLPSHSLTGNGQTACRGTPLFSFTDL